jgi:hypothetical protein
MRALRRIKASKIKRISKLIEIKYKSQIIIIIIVALYITSIYNLFWVYHWLPLNVKFIRYPWITTTSIAQNRVIST